MADQRMAIREIRVVWETPPSNFAKSDIHIMDRVSQALAQVQNVHISVAFFDENGQRLRRTDFYEGTPKMQLVADEELGINTDQPAA